MEKKSRERMKGRKEGTKRGVCDGGWSRDRVRGGKREIRVPFF